MASAGRVNPRRRSPPTKPRRVPRLDREIGVDQASPRRRERSRRGPAHITSSTVAAPSSAWASPSGLAQSQHPARIAAARILSAVTGSSAVQAASRQRRARRPSRSGRTARPQRARRRRGRATHRRGPSLWERLRRCERGSPAPRFRDRWAGCRRWSPCGEANTEDRELPSATSIFGICRYQCKCRNLAYVAAPAYVGASSPRSMATSRARATRPGAGARRLGWCRRRGRGRPRSRR